MCQCPESCQNHLKICQIDINNIILKKRPKKSKFHLAFFQKSKKAKGVEKRPKITNLASKKPNWQPWLA